MTIDAPSPTRPARRSYRWWLLFPFVWQAGLAPLVNDIGLRPFGLPFPMAWQMVGIVMTSAVIAWVYRRDVLTGVDTATGTGEGRA